MKTIDMDEFLSGEGGGGGGRPPRGPRKPPGGRGGPNFEPKLKHLLFLLAGLAALILVILGITGRLGVMSLTHSQVAVRVNYLTGSSEVITTPGNKVYIPFIEEIFPLDRTPQKFLMAGDRVLGDNHVPFLTVRASDGSNFWFESLEIQYEVIPSMADEVLRDSGPASGFKRDWIRAYSRSVLRDEFGKYSALQVANPSSYQSARVESTKRLNELLAPHGIEVRDVITPKPRFDKEYDQAIEDRLVADQDVERLREEESRLRNERQRRLSGVEKDKSIQREELLGELQREKFEADRQKIQIELAATAYEVERLAEGTAERDQKVLEASGLREKYTKEAEGIQARAQALEKRGEVVVREALIQKLSEIEFTLIPYSRDPIPKRLEHVDARSNVHAELTGTGDERGN